MKPLSIQIVHAQPGFFTIYDFNDVREVGIGEPIIAWRIETYANNTGDGLFSTCTPITADGDAGSNCIGVQNPDMTVYVFEDSNHRSLADLQANRYPKK